MRDIHTTVREYQFEITVADSEYRCERTTRRIISMVNCSFLKNRSSLTEGVAAVSPHQAFYLLGTPPRLLTEPLEGRTPWTI
jgi:hypothetical protein